MPAVREFLEKENRIYELAAEVKGLLVGSVTIAAYSSISTHWLPEVIRDFEQDYSQIEIRLMEGIRQEVTRWLDEKKADIGFLSYQEPMPYEWTPLDYDEMLAVLPKDHPYASKESYPLINCETDSFIMPALGRDDDVVSLFERNGIKLNIHFTTLENFATMAMIEKGLGMSVMNNLITEKWNCDVVKIPVDPPSRITLGLAVPSYKQASPAVKRFIKDCGNPSRGNGSTVCKEPAAVGILCNYQKRYTGEIIKGKSVCRDDGECTGGNHICISERL